MWTASINN